jgi:hypothetical protein
MKKYLFVVCAFGASSLSPCALAGIAHAEDRPRAARVDVSPSKDNVEATKPPAATEKANTRTGNRVHMGPTTVTVIDDGEAIDDVVSRVRQARIDRLRQGEPRKDSKDSKVSKDPKDHPLARSPEDRPLREHLNRLEKKLEGRRDGRRPNAGAEERGDKREERQERRDDASDKREERIERIKEKREQRTQTDQAGRGGRPEKQ